MANEHAPSSKPMPRRLHKYRAFNTHTLRLLTDAEVYYANPRQFNDPLDSAPTIIVDVDLNSLERLCYRMLLNTRTKDEAKRVIQELHHYSTEYGDYRTDPKTEDYLKRLVADRVKSIVDFEMATNGIFSLAEKWDCPLMWSHYADEHRGMCIGYDILEAEHKEMAAVNYRCPRGIRASDVLAGRQMGQQMQKSEYETPTSSQSRPSGGMNGSGVILRAPLVRSTEAFLLAQFISACGATGP